MCLLGQTSNQQYYVDVILRQKNVADSLILCYYQQPPPSTPNIHSKLTNYCTYRINVLNNLQLRPSVGAEWCYYQQARPSIALRYYQQNFNLLDSYLAPGDMKHWTLFLYLPRSRLVLCTWWNEHSTVLLYYCSSEISIQFIKIQSNSMKFITIQWNLNKLLKFRAFQSPYTVI